MTFSSLSRNDNANTKNSRPSSESNYITTQFQRNTTVIDY